MFGRPFPPNINEVPPLIKQGLEYIEEKGTDEQGIFRLSGDYEKINQIVRSIDRGDNVDLRKFDPLTVAAVMKKYFRDSPEPLCTFEYYDCFLAAVTINDKKTAKYEIKKLFHFLPASNQIILRYLILFLNRFTKYKDKTLMGSANLAIVFAPNILRSGGNDLAAEIQESTLAQQLCQIMIDDAQYIFTEDAPTGPPVRSPSSPKAGTAPPTLPKPGQTPISAAQTQVSPRGGQPPALLPKPNATATKPTVNGGVAKHHSHTRVPSLPFGAPTPMPKPTVNQTIPVRRGTTAPAPNPDITKAPTPAPGATWANGEFRASPKKPSLTSAVPARPPSPSLTPAMAKFNNTNPFGGSSDGNDATPPQPPPKPTGFSPVASQSNRNRAATTFGVPLRTTAGPPM